MRALSVQRLSMEELTQRAGQSITRIDAIRALLETGERYDTLDIQSYRRETLLQEVIHTELDATFVLSLTLWSRRTPVQSSLHCAIG